MIESITDILKAVLPGIIIATFTSFLTVHLAIRRFHKDKWWEKKQEIYSSILNTLHNLKNYAEEQYEARIYPGYITAEKNEELKLEWKAFFREFAKLVDLAPYHLSDKAVAVLTEYKKKTDVACKSGDIIDRISRDIEAVSKCLEELKIAAKNDLKIK